MSSPEMGAVKHRFSFLNDLNGIALEIYEI